MAVVGLGRDKGTCGASQPLHSMVRLHARVVQTRIIDTG
jgi:hypothetical protein